MRAILRNAWIVLFMVLLILVGLRPDATRADFLPYLLIYLAAWVVYLLVVYAWLMWCFPFLRASDKS